MTLPDNRMRFPAPKIDFAADVGETGQDHDHFPDAGQQPRYDWMRMAIISLLALQSSYDEPTQKRFGTPWMDLNDHTLKVYDGTVFQPIADFISTGIGDDSTDGVVKLSSWILSIDSIVSQLSPKLTFGGSSSSDNVAVIPIPDSLQEAITANSRPLVYINGRLVDPRNCEFNTGCVTQILLTGGVELNTGDVFTAIIDSFGMFYEPDVIV